MEEPKPRRAADLVIETSNDATLVHNPRTEKVHILNASAAFILARCDGQHSLQELAHALASDSRASHDLQADVEAIFREFRNFELIELPTPAQA